MKADESRVIVTTPKERIREFFEMSQEQFDREWPELTTRDKLDLTKGIKSGTLNY